MLYARPSALLSTLCAVLLGCLACASDPDPVKCQLAAGDPRIEAIETRCDGVDNDCDGIVDRLAPVAANACQSDGTGACATGYAACQLGARTCLVPPAVAEVHDGIDNDCNGKTDDVVLSSVPLRARVLIAPYLWNANESPTLSDAVAETLAHVGIPNVALPSSVPSLDDKIFDWNTGFHELDQYSLVILPGYLETGVVTAEQLQKLEAFVTAGGILVWSKPIGPDPTAGPQEAAPLLQVMALGGLTGSTRHMEGTQVRISADVPAALYLDAPEERTLLLSKDTAKAPAEVFTYDLDAASGAHTFGHAYAADKDLGAVLVRRPLGKGAVYTLGVDLFDSYPVSCYINCFDPGNDLIAMLLRGMYREAAGGHYVVKHTVPGTQSTAFAVTHDVDAPDAQNDGPQWGEAGAVQMVRMEKSLGVKGSYMITSDYVTGYYNPDMVKRMCALGMCPQGGHSVQHFSFNPMPKGDCSVSKATYDPSKPTVCGEVVVDLKLLNALLPQDTPIRAWRTPYLSQNPALFDVLASMGVVYDSSFATGDLRTAFPVSMARTRDFQELFHHNPMYTFAIVQEDGMGGFGADGSTTRTELKPSTRPTFAANWKYAFLRNMANNAWNVMLVHPSYGLGVGPSNLAVKIDSVRQFIKTVKPLDVVIEQIDALGDFWRGRDGVQLSADFDAAKGYSGKLEVGTVAAPHFSLEFGDQLASFDCPSAGPFTLAGNRVVFTDPLPAGATLTFTAVSK